VVGATPLVEVAKSQPSSVVTVQQMENIPVLSRSFLEMAQILPGSGPDNSKIMTEARDGTTRWAGRAANSP